MIFALSQLQENDRKKRKSIFLAFVNHPKDLDLVDRHSLFSTLLKAKCPPILLSLIRSFHNGMQARVQIDSKLSDNFPTKRTVKQDCVLAHILFGIYYPNVFRIVNSKLQPSISVLLITRDNGNFFNSANFKARLLYASYSMLMMQSPLSLFAPSYSECTRLFLQDLSQVWSFYQPDENWNYVTIS